MLYDNEIAKLQHDIGNYSLWADIIAKQAGDAQGVDAMLRSTWGKEEPKILGRQRAKKIDRYNGFVIQLLLDREITARRLKTLLRRQAIITSLLNKLKWRT